MRSKHSEITFRIQPLNQAGYNFPFYCCELFVKRQQTKNHHHGCFNKLNISSDVNKNVCFKDHQIFKEEILQRMDEAIKINRNIINHLR